MTEYIGFTASVILEWLKISSNVLLAMGNKQITTPKLQISPPTETNLKEICQCLRSQISEKANLQEKVISKKM